MNKTEKLEAEISNNLKALEEILLNDHCMRLEQFRDKKIKIK